MADTSDIKKGFKLLLDGVPFAVVDHQFVKPGKGQAFVRTRMKNMMTGAVIDRTFKSGEKLDKADTEERTMQYLYPEGEARVFMDTQSYEQLTLTNEQLGENVHYLLDGTEVDVMLFEGRPIGVTPPNFVELLVTETEPGFSSSKADWRRASGPQASRQGHGSRPALLRGARLPRDRHSGVSALPRPRRAPFGVRSP